MLYRRILDALTTTLTMMVSSPYGGTALLLAVVLTLLVPTTYVLVDHPTLRPLLLNVLAIAIGATIGWLWGGASIGGPDKIAPMVSTVAALIVAVLGNFPAVKKALDDLKQPDLDSTILYELFIKPFKNAAFLSALQFAALGFIIFFFASLAFTSMSNRAEAKSPPAAALP